MFAVNKLIGGILSQKEEYVKQQREKREQNRDHQKDCTCLVCGYTTREPYW